MPRLQLHGTVVSDRMEKTAVVLVERLVQHPLLKKFIRHERKFMAHNPGTPRLAPQQFFVHGYLVDASEPCVECIREVAV